MEDAALPKGNATFHAKSRSNRHTQQMRLDCDSGGAYSAGVTRGRMQNTIRPYWPKIRTRGGREGGVGEGREVREVREGGGSKNVRKVGMARLVAGGSVRGSE